jgi:hypothetical protein
MNKLTLDISTLTIESFQTTETMIENSETGNACTTTWCATGDCGAAKR